MIFICVLVSCVHVLCHRSSVRTCSRELVGQCLKQAGSPASGSDRRYPAPDGGYDCLCPMERQVSVLLCNTQNVNENHNLSLFPPYCVNKVIHTLFQWKFCPYITPHVWFWLYGNSSLRIADLLLSVLRHPHCFIVQIVLT